MVMIIKTRSRFKQAFGLLSDKLKTAVSAISAETAEEICELRLRKGRYLTAVISGKEYFIERSGKLSRSCENAAEVTENDIAFTFKAAFRGSVHSFPRELSEGFITCDGGNRAGFCGTASLTNENGLIVVREISSVSIRIAHEIKGCAKKLYDMAFADGLCSLIIASPPCGGKTTILRDLCRMLGNEYKAVLVDERSEIAAVNKGVPQNDIGLFTDVFNGYPKAETVNIAVRTMSPDVVICDEIGSANELDALFHAADSGVRLICTCHSPSLDDLRKSPAAGELISRGVFDCAAILGTGSLCGKVIGFRRFDTVNAV